MWLCNGCSEDIDIKGSEDFFKGRALMREVRIASQRSGGFLVDGLVGGENVITTAPQNLKDGQKIKIKGQS